MGTGLGMGPNRGQEAPFNVASVTSDMAAPTTEAEFVATGGNFAHAAWVVKKPSWVASYSVSLYRYEGGKNGTAVIIVQEGDTITGLVDNYYTVQASLETRISLRIHDIVGTPDDAFDVLWYPCNVR